MVRQKIIFLMLLSFIVAVACIDPLTVKKRDNTTTSDNKTNTDNATDNDSFLGEPQPPIVDGAVIVTDAMLRPFPKESYKSPYNYVVTKDYLVIEGGKEVFADPSLKAEDPCTKEFYDSLTDAKFLYNDRIYITNRKQLNEFYRIYDGEYGPSKYGVTFVLVKDIDMCSNQQQAFYPIGIPTRQIATTTSFFWATFDGDNNIVKSIYVKRDGYEGFNCAGFICGLNGAYASGRLQNIGVSGTIEISIPWSDTNKMRGAGLVGFSNGGEIRNVVSNLNITAKSNVGGIVGMVATGESGDGYAKPAHISNVKNYANVKGESNVGGIVGLAIEGNSANASKAENIYKSIVNWGTVTSTDNTSLGGLFGNFKNFNDKSPVTCKNGGKPTILFGAASGTVFNCD